jgi:hypothetical protein
MGAVGTTTVTKSKRVLPVVNPAVIYRSLTEGAVLFSTEDEVYFGLNGVGARVWELLSADHHDFDGICDVLSAEYSDVSFDVLRQDIEELLEDLQANRLVTARRPGTSRDTALDRTAAEGRDA